MTDAMCFSSKFDAGPPAHASERLAGQAGERRRCLPEN
ncbi:hypothetical protein BSLA_01r1220 [Burkholderia stabilis]|nr:hypothetical protein BSLA_01r1220 [Burkholderia stabilis]